MSKEIKMKKIRVRPGMTGFYTSILESGQVALIPADQEETENGWFDDVADDVPVSIGADRVARQESPTKNVEKYGDGSGDVPRGESTTDQEINLVGSESDQPPSLNGVVEGEDKVPVDQNGKDDESEDTKGSTKADIIKELESLGVMEFNRSANKGELQARLDMVKSALEQGE